MNIWRATAWISADTYDEAMEEVLYLNKGKTGILITVDENSITYEGDE
jgi:hypothetical protein